MHVSTTVGEPPQGVPGDGKDPLGAAHAVIGPDISGELSDLFELHSKGRSKQTDRKAGCAYLRSN